MRATHTLIMLALCTLLESPLGAERQRPLPAGYNTGRCLLVVNGKKRIAGECFYKIYKDGSFHIDGPRQIYDGIDYPKARGMADQMSRDYWADVSREHDRWSGYGNSDIRAVHGDRTWTLRRQGACFVGDEAKICLWRK